MFTRKSFMLLVCSLGCFVLILNFLMPNQISACSTFKLQKGDSLIYGHNLNQGDIGVPGLIFINKRGIFKLGRTWSELTTKERLNPSSHCWISRYGSVTFNAFGRDLPDGGMNEVGLYIWEMSQDADYPKNDSLPKLNQMHWMQYILDNYSTVEEAIQCASEIEIDGWGWHFFVGDAKGNTAAIAFIGGEVVVNKGEDMPVPGLFNLPYNRELEYLKYYKGFGGLYEPDLNDPRVPRFVKTAVMIRDYEQDKNIVDYGFQMLDKLTVWDVPEWSIVFDVRKRHVYFKTRINPEIKSFSMDKIDFSNNSPVLILNMDIKNGGDVLNKFHPYTNEEMREFIKKLIFPILPEQFFTRGGITLDEYLERTSTHSDAAALAEKQFFKGVWKNEPDTEKDEMEIIFSRSIIKGSRDFIHSMQYFSPQFRKPEGGEQFQKQIEVELKSIRKEERYEKTYLHTISIAANVIYIEYYRLRFFSLYGSKGGQGVNRSEWRLKKPECYHACVASF